jgi:hypothetical protein
MINYLFVLFMFLSLVIAGKGAYDIYWTGEKAQLKGKAIVKYGLPLLCTLLLLPYIARVF